MFGFTLEGTVAEPWSTAEELWADPEVQKIIKEHNKSVSFNVIEDSLEVINQRIYNASKEKK